jgi:AraC-like DNA-binding protein
MFRLLFAGAGASAYLVLALVAGRAEGSRTVRAALIAASLLSAVGLVMDSPAGDALRRTGSTLDVWLRILAAGAPGGLWLALIALFRDRKVLRSHLPLALTPLAAAAPAFLMEGDPAWLSFWIWTGTSAALVIHAIILIVRTARSDLVESRRRLRLWIGGVSVFGCCVLLLLLVTIVADAGRVDTSPWWRTTLRGLMAATAIAAAAIVLDPRRQLIPNARRGPTPVGSEDSLIEQLTRIMAAESLWREERLTLAGLAVRLRTPEYRLRQAINGRLGHRNFPEFVNGFRVDAAKALLADPENKANVAEVAYAVGFGSLAPFNRAFKETTGLTPTQWRRSKLIEI